MISKAQVKWINRLQQKKYRYEHRAFIAEGAKIAEELLNSSIRVLKIFANPDWLLQNKTWLSKVKAELIPVSDTEMKKISLLTTPSEVLLIAEIPELNMNHNKENKGTSLVLDEIQDPGNMGSIIRTADWFSMNSVFISENCADPFSPKVVQASMGSITRVKMIQCNLIELFEKNKKTIVYGLMLRGKSLFMLKPKSSCFILVGSEGKGISNELLSYVHHQITIPGKGKAESLNAAVAAGITCAWFANHPE